MNLSNDTDAAYLVLPKARIRIAGFYYLKNRPHRSDRGFRKGSILVEC